MVKVIVVALLLAVATLFPFHAIEAANNDQWERRIYKAINEKRETRGLDRLRRGPCPNNTAEAWARKLDRKDRFFHQDMSKVLTRCDALLAGEVLARGLKTPRATVRAWMHSDSHRAVIMRARYDKIGVAARRTPYGRLIAVNVIDK